MKKHIDKLCLHCNNIITLIKHFIKHNIKQKRRNLKCKTTIEVDATVEVADVTKDQEEDVDAMKVVDADHLVDYLAETIADAEIAEFYSS